MKYVAVLKRLNNFAVLKEKAFRSMMNLSSSSAYQVHSSLFNCTPLGSILGFSHPFNLSALIITSWINEW